MLFTKNKVKFSFLFNTSRIERFLQLFVFLVESNISPLKESASIVITTSEEWSSGVGG